METETELNAPIVLGTQSDTEEVVNTLSNFNNQLKQRIQEIEETDKRESCFISDEASGLKFEGHSKFFNSKQLAEIGLSVFDNLLIKRQGVKTSYT